MAQRILQVRNTADATGVHPCANLHIQTVVASHWILSSDASSWYLGGCKQTSSFLQGDTLETDYKPLLRVVCQTFLIYDHLLRPARK